MKKTIILLLTLALVLACLAACGAVQAEPTATPVPAAAAPTAAPTAAPATETPAPTAAELSLKDKATACIGKSVEELYAAIGEPDTSDYAPSCLGSGEDGILYYDGFSVYTYRENGSERVENVL